LAAAVLTFGLGIGASTACSAWRTSVLLRPLPYKDRAQLVYACNDLKTRSVYDHFWSDRNYMDLRDQAHSALEDVAAINTFRGSLARDDGAPEEIVFASVPPNFLLPDRRACRVGPGLYG
jgi:hypothetical protein